MLQTYRYCKFLVVSQALMWAYVMPWIQILVLVNPAQLVHCWRIYDKSLTSICFLLHTLLGHYSNNSSPNIWTSLEVITFMYLFEKVGERLPSGKILFLSWKDQLLCSVGAYLENEFRNRLRTFAGMILLTNSLSLLLFSHWI